MSSTHQNKHYKNMKSKHMHTCTHTHKTTSQISMHSQSFGNEHWADMPMAPSRAPEGYFSIPFVLCVTYPLLFGCLSTQRWSQSQNCPAYMPCLMGAFNLVAWCGGSQIVEHLMDDHWASNVLLDSLIVIFVLLPLPTPSLAPLTCLCSIHLLVFFLLASSTSTLFYAVSSNYLMYTSDVINIDLL